MSDRQVAGDDAVSGARWGETHRLLSSRPTAELTAPDLERLAVASYLTGRDDEAVAAWEQAHDRRLGEGDHAAAALCAFWAAFCLMVAGRMGHAGGWLQRTEAAVGGRDCAAAGYLLVPALLGSLDAGDGARARDLAIRAGEIAERFGDHDLGALAVLGQGQALLELGDREGSTARFDEVMLSVGSGEVGPIVSGIVYCAVVLACMEAFDLARAAEWTDALEGWCAAQPDLVPYRGQCLVHRSQLQQAAGDWARAVTTVRAARERLADPPHPALGLACYQEAELLRLRGEHDAAAEAYGRASRAGHQPMPGLALLDRARGELPAAVAGIRRALLETDQAFQRPRLLAAAVDVLVDAGELDEAEDAARELADLAESTAAPALRAMARQARGTVALAEGRLPEALRLLRSASETWHELQVPYETARISVQIARACLALDDRATADMELAGASETFEGLGARADLEELGELIDGHDEEHPLSPRELEVLAQVARGRTNREIARELSISAHTVGRHLENISARLGVSGRAAITAWAYEHDLL
jgi:DNA-binding CsgD family transcriptional regulator